jgi:uncharacterized membrane protein YfcA
MKLSNRKKHNWRDARVNRIQGMMMLVAAVVAFWIGWRNHHLHSPLLAFGLGTAALALAAWHLTRKSPPPPA